MITVQKVNRRNFLKTGVGAAAGLTLSFTLPESAKLKAQGRSRDEIVVAKPTAAYDAKFGNFVIDPGFFTRLVYETV